MIWRTALVTGVACFATGVGTRDVLAQEAGARAGVPVPSAAVRTVEQFHAALATGDSSTVAALLDTSAVVLESGAPSGWRIVAIHWSSHRRAP